MDTIPNSMQELLESITPEIHEQLKTAVDLGRWENGEKLTAEQKEHCLQAVIAYDLEYTDPEKRVGFLRGKDGCKPGEQ
ncbi:MAG: DUF1315 family protein [Gammaproteobacteria bacterium]